MKILVLGSEGQIGSPLCNHLISLNHEVTRWDQTMGHHYDLCNTNNSRHLLNAIQNSDKIIFLAFEVGGSKFLENSDKTFCYIDRNVRLMSNVFEAISSIRRPLLFTSSQMSNMHHTNYGFLKELGERYTKAIGGWICRFWNVYGKESCVPEKTHVITDFIKMAKEGGVITMRTDGMEQRQFLHTDDSSVALTQWIEDKWDNKDKYYDITSFEWTSIANIASIIAVKLGARIQLGTGKDNIQLGICNQPSEYIRKFWMPQVTLDQGISRIIREM